MSNVDCQFSKFSPPNDVNYTNCTLSNGFPKSYCPIGTYCVDSVLAMGVWYPGMTVAQTVLSELTSPGCCPNNTNPCLSKTLPFAVPGCCPVNQQCCFSKLNRNHFIGCVDIPEQCCGDTICPPDYSCCHQDGTSSYYCCPGQYGCGTSMNTSITGNIPTEFTSVPNAYFTGTNPLVNMRPYTKCRMPILNGTDHIPWPENMTISCGKKGSVCLNETEDCYSKSGINLSLNPDNNATIFENQGEFCCPKNTTVCPMSERKNQRTIIGCANTAIGESCCASQICPPGSKCCNVLPPNDGTWVTSTLFPGMEYYNSSFVQYVPNPYNESAIILPNNAICCPEGTFCAAKLLNTEKSMTPNRRRIFVYCSRNEYGTSNAMESETIQTIASFGSWLPDFIDNYNTRETSRFWQDPVDRFTNDAFYATQQNCNNCNAFSSSGSCKFSCEDQCALDIKARFT